MKYIVIFILLFAGAWLIYKFVVPDWKNKKRIRSILWAFVALFLFLGAIGSLGSDSDTDSSSSNSSQSAKSSSKKSSNSKANKALAKQLEQDQGWANGTLDENGSSTDSGEPQSQFNWATHIQKMTYNKNDGLSIYFYDSGSLPTSEKNEIVSSARLSATSALMDAGTLSDDEVSDGFPITVYQGNKIIGTSKVSDNKNISWD